MIYLDRSILKDSSKKNESILKEDIKIKFSV